MDQKYLPDSLHDVTITADPYEIVVDGCFMIFGLLLIDKHSVRDPEVVGHLLTKDELVIGVICSCFGRVKSQAFIVPVLSKIHLDGIVLESTTK